MTQTQGKGISAEDLGGLLFDIHTHGELVESEEIVYREEDVIKLLKLLGYPEPIWGKSLDIDKTLLP